MGAGESSLVDLPRLTKADAVLSEATRRLRLVIAVRPENELEQKDLFVSGKVRQPKFRYSRPAPIDMSEVESLELPNCYWGELLATTRRRLLRLHSLLGMDGELNVRDFSREVYGAPSEQLQSAARRLLSKVKFEPGKEVTWEFTRDVLQKSLDEFGLTGWTVKKAPGDFTSARTSEKTIYLTPIGKLYEGTAERLAVHEIGVHAVRSYNGDAQPLSHFSFGWPGYEITEEGLATYAELHTGLISKRAVVNYSARVLAVASLDRGQSFQHCYESLRELGLNTTLAWEAALRAYRGNGFYKDHIYLQGLLEVFQFITDGGDWENLFVGKVGLHHLDRVKADLQLNKLRRPSVVPDFLKRERKKTELWDLVSSLVSA